jgi:hypothetical protein
MRSRRDADISGIYGYNNLINIPTTKTLILFEISEGFALISSRYLFEKSFLIKSIIEFQKSQIDHLSCISTNSCKIILVFEINHISNALNLSVFFSNNFLISLRHKDHLYWSLISVVFIYLQQFQKVEIHR